MKSPLMKELEAELAGKIVEDLRKAIDTAAGTLAASAQLGLPRAQHEKAIELRYAVLALVEIAIRDGGDAVASLMAVRDVGITLWGQRAFQQHAGNVCRKCIAADLQAISSIYFAAVGNEKDFVKVMPLEEPDAVAVTTRH